MADAKRRGTVRARVVVARERGDPASQVADYSDHRWGKQQTAAGPEKLYDRPA